MIQYMMTMMKELYIRGDQVPGASPQTATPFIIHKITKKSMLISAQTEIFLSGCSSVVERLVANEKAVGPTPITRSKSLKH